MHVYSEKLTKFTACLSAQLYKLICWFWCCLNSTCPKHFNKVTFLCFTKRFPKPVFFNHKKPILLNITMWIQWRRKVGSSKVAPKMAKINSILGLLWTKQIYMGLLWTNMLSLAFLEIQACPLVDEIMYI